MSERLGSDVACDPCGAFSVGVTFCDVCGIDYCEDCEEFHAAIHPEVARAQGAAECDGLCVTAADIGVPTTPGAVAYPHPGCPAHAPEQVCTCDYPDQCLSPTHGQISLNEALRIRRSQGWS